MTHGIETMQRLNAEAEAKASEEADRHFLRRAGANGLVLGGRLWNLLAGLFGSAQYIDEITALVALLPEWNAITATWGTVDGLKARLSVLIRAAKIAASMTANTADDAMAAQLESLSQNDALITLLASILAKFDSPQAALAAIQSGEDHQSLVAAAAAQGIDFNVLVQAIQLIVQLISMLGQLFGQGGATGGTPTTPGTTPPAGNDKFGF